MRDAPIWRRSGLLVIVLCAIVTGCASFAAEPEARFEVGVADERFVIEVTDGETIKTARENVAGQNSLHPTGTLTPGDGDFNSPHGWHLIPASVRMVEMSIELCDGLPSHIDRDLEHWLTAVKRYCPWKGRIVRELPASAH